MPPSSTAPAALGNGLDAAALNHRFAALAFCRADLVFELDDAMDIVFVAGPTPRLLGPGPAELRGTSFLDLFHANDRKLAEQMLSSASRVGRIDDVILRLSGPDGRSPAVAMAGYRVPDMANHFFMALKVEPVKANYIAPKDLKRAEETGVLTQESFSEVAAQRLQSYTRAGGEAKMTMVKINNLKELEGTLDGAEKDKLLNTIGDILKEKSLGGDTAGQLDEEHYGIVHTPDTDVSDLGEQIETAAHKIKPDSKIPLGTDLSTMDAETADLNDDQIAKAIIYTMRKFCDNKGKVSGTSLSGMLNNMTANTMQMVETFQNICKTGDFDVVFMPLCDLKTGELHHYEALSRFRKNVDGGGESPYQLVTLAEEIGVISEFDLAVVRKTIKVMKYFNRGRDENLPIVAVNVSGYSISNPNFLRRLHEILNVDKNLSEIIMFEITESAKIEDLETVNSIIQGLRTRGFKVCLDDFGAGAASFDYLNSLDVDVVKFDGPVVNRAFASQKGTAFLTSMATMCKKSGIETVAEMVENEELEKFLAECGIDLGQGYYYGKADKDPRKFLNKDV